MSTLFSVSERDISFCNFHFKTRVKLRRSSKKEEECRKEMYRLKVKGQSYSYANSPETDLPGKQQTQIKLSQVDDTSSSEITSLPGCPMASLLRSHWQYSGSVSVPRGLACPSQGPDAIPRHNY